jgi:hypothetical protein
MVESAAKPASGVRTALIVLLLAAALLAGCSQGAKDKLAQVDEQGQPCTTLHGVVVDEAIRPVADVLVEVVGVNATVEPTGADGTFMLPCLADGAYTLRAAQPLYSSVQQSFEIGADVDGREPSILKVQLQRLIFGTPYAATQSFEGFVVCSVGFFEYASEECGEGVGVPCEVPLQGCNRVGGQSNNHAQWDFYLDGGFASTLVVDMVWEPTSDTLKEFQLNLGNDWTCDPTCNGNPLNVTGGPSPLYATVDFDGLNLTDKAGNPVPFDANTRFSTFIWPNWGCANFGVSTDPDCLQQLNVAVNQQYQAFATAFYYLPAPAGWSFLTDENPYK